MAKVDYSHLNLPPIQKNLYKEHPSVTNRSEVSFLLKRTTTFFQQVA